MFAADMPAAPMCFIGIIGRVQRWGGGLVETRLDSKLQGSPGTHRPDLVSETVAQTEEFRRAVDGEVIAGAGSGRCERLTYPEKKV